VKKKKSDSPDVLECVWLRVNNGWYWIIPDVSDEFIHLVFDLMDENDNKLIPFHIWLDG
jgi:hypothetical protein